jgi:Asp/Glu/hydantoin racemase
MHVRILVINPNASVELSRLIERQACAIARPDVDVDVLNRPPKKRPGEAVFELDFR